MLACERQEHKRYVYTHTLRLNGKHIVFNLGPHMIQQSSVSISLIARARPEDLALDRDTICEWYTASMTPAIALCGTETLIPISKQTSFIRVYKKFIEFCSWKQSNRRTVRPIHCGHPLYRENKQISSYAPRLKSIKVRYRLFNIPQTGVEKALAQNKNKYFKSKSFTARKKHLPSTLCQCAQSSGLALNTLQSPLVTI